MSCPPPAAPRWPAGIPTTWPAPRSIRGSWRRSFGDTVWRWLSADAVKPWQHRSWIFPRDPDFAAKAGRVLDLCHRRWKHRKLGRRDYVISADEKTSIQARIRKHPTTPPAAKRTMRVEHEHTRGGALAWLAAWDVHRAKVHGRCEATTGIEPFGRLVAQVMAAEPYASARRVFWIVDNGSSHRGQAFIDRLQGRWANLRLIHLPVHASWLNQVEICFSVVQRKVLTPTTPLILTKSRSGCWPSRPTTSRSPPRSSGSSPAKTSMPCSPAPPTRPSAPQPDRHR
ncbi:MAG: transposase [Egibacteraceae bacterium]